MSCFCSTSTNAISHKTFKLKVTNFLISSTFTLEFCSIWLTIIPECIIQLLPLSTFIPSRLLSLTTKNKFIYKTIFSILMVCSSNVSEMNLKSNYLLIVSFSTRDLKFLKWILDQNLQH